MNCPEFSSNLDDFIDGLLPHDTAARMSAHCHSCDSCRVSYDRANLLDAASIRAVTMAEPPDHLWFRVQSKLASRESKPGFRIWQLFPNPTFAALSLLAAIVVGLGAPMLTPRFDIDQPRQQIETAGVRQGATYVAGHAAMGSGQAAMSDVASAFVLNMSAGDFGPQPGVSTHEHTN